MTPDQTTTMTNTQRYLSLAAVITSAFGVGLAFGIGFPLTALTLEGWGAAKWVIGLAGAAPALAILAALPYLPKIVQRFGTAQAICAGCAIAAAGFLMLSLSGDAVSWIAVRVIMSAGLALPWLAGETWINAIVPDHMRGRVIAVYAMTFFCGFALGPIVLAALGTGGLTVFIAGAVGTALAGLPILAVARLAPDLPQEGHTSSWQAMWLAPAAMVGGFMAGFAEITCFSLIPSVGLASGLTDTDALTLLTTLTVGGILCQFPAGWLADKMNRRHLMMIIAVGFIALSFALIPALNAGLTAYVVAFLLGGTTLAFYTIGLAIIGERVPHGELAAANAAFLVFYQAGAIIGPMLAGVAMSFDAITGFVVAVTGLMLLAIILLGVLGRNSVGHG